MFAERRQKKFENRGRVRTTTKHGFERMALKADSKTTFEPARVIQPIYTGGSVALSEDGTVLATSLGDEALLTNLETGEHLARIEGVSLILYTA